MARRLTAETILLLCVPLVFGVWSLWLGQDGNWDLRNYHWYDAYALLDWRFHRDVAPAAVQTFLSPLFYVPWFVLAQWLPAPAMGFLIGAVQSANFVLLYLLGRRVMAGWFFPLLIAVIGVAGPTSRNLIGTTFCDLLQSICVVGALYLTALAVDPKNDRPMRAAFLAGAALGFAAAGKLTAAPYAIASVASLAIIGLPWSDKARLALAICAGGVVAGAIFMAPWDWWLYHRYGSPTFPFLNGIFKSPWTALPNLFNPQERPPHGLLAWLAYPYEFTRHPRLVSSIGAQDYRMLAGYLLIPSALALRWIMRAPPVPQFTRYLILFAAISYLLWAASLNVDRYAVPIAMLTPLLIAALLLDFSDPLQKPALALLLGSLIFLGGGSYERLPWSRAFVRAELPSIADPARTLVVFVNTPLGYLAPSLPEPVTIVQLDDAGQSPLWRDHLRAVIAKPWHAILGFVAAPYPEQYESRAEAVGLTIDAGSCRPVPNTFASLNAPALLCRVVRKEVPPRTEE